MEKNSRIYIAGHRGMVGSAIVAELTKQGYGNLVTRNAADLDLRRQSDVEAFFEQERPEYVFLAAAKVGGIAANNTYRADFIYDNLAIELNIIHSATISGVKKLLFLGSSCIYPRLAPQPLKEEYLLTGELEPTNEPYAIAKIAGIKLCEAYRDQHDCNFISAMPTNLYGINDNYHPQHSHVLPGLIRRFHEAGERGAGEVVVWGSGMPKREFLFSSDLGNACVFLMQHYNDKALVNVGTGLDISIAELADMVRDVTGFKGEIVYDTTQSDGTPRKLMDVTKIHNLGWRHTVELKEGIALAYADFIKKTKGETA